MNGTDATRGSGITAAAPPRVFLSHTPDLGKPDEPGSFVAAAVAAVLRAAGGTVRRHPELFWEAGALRLEA